MQALRVQRSAGDYVEKRELLYGKRCNYVRGNAV